MTTGGGAVSSFRVMSDRGYDRRVRRKPLVVDLAICAALFAYALPVTLRSDEAGAGTWVDSLVLPAATLPLLLRRRDPLTAAAALAAGSVVSGIPTFDQFRLIAVIPAGRTASTRRVPSS